MADMVSFFSVMLGVVADFLSSDPIIYLFGLACLCYVIVILKRLLP